MKCINKILVIGFMTLFLLVTVSPALEINSATQNTEVIILDFSFLEPQIDKIKIKDEIYDRITIDGLPNTRDFKKPCLPTKSVRLLLPQGRDLKNIKVIIMDFQVQCLFFILSLKNFLRF